MIASIRFGVLLRVVGLLFAGAAAEGRAAMAFEVTFDQTEGMSAAPDFHFTGSVEGIEVRNNRAFYPCCLEFVPSVELEGGVLRVVETDRRADCLCADVPWSLRTTVTGLPPGTYDVLVEKEDGNLLATATVTLPATRTAVFVRGSMNGDDQVNLSDAVFTLMYLFQEGKPPPCLDAADVNDDGLVDISDPIRLLGYLLLGPFPQPPPPFDAPGEDPTEDSIVCSLENSVTAGNFIRTRDFDGNGQNDLTDGVAFLNFLFLGHHAPPCEDAVDGNDDGVLNMDDLCVLCPPCCPFLLIIDPPPPLPPPRECGPDPTPDRIGCNSSPCGS